MSPTTRPGGRKARPMRSDKAPHPATMNPSMALYTHLRARPVLATRPASTREWNRLPADNILRARALPARIQPAHPGKTMGLSGYIPKNPAIKNFKF